MRLLKNKIILLIILSQTFFILPFFITILLLFVSLSFVKTSHLALARTTQSIAHPILLLTDISHTVAFPFLTTTGLSQYTNQFVRTLHLSYNTLRYGLDTIEDGKIFATMVMSDEGSLDTKVIRSNQQTVHRFIQNFNRLHTNLFLLKTSIHNKTVDRYYTLIDATAPVVQQLPSLLGGTKSKTYIVLLLNNKELRPGGGFIGSYAVIKTDKYRISSITLEDVYQTDGQLKEHIEPHPAVKTYLQPNGFLRDSNFSPDFKDDAENALYYLDRSIQMQNVDGVIGITTDAIAQLIALIEPIELPNSNLRITQNNFYFITQSEVEKNFFPGSAKKKLFLSELSRTMLHKLRSSSIQDLTQKLGDLLKQKHIVAYMHDPIVQTYLESQNWAGRQSENQMNDYLMPVEANVGANKGNVFVKRHYDLSIELQEGTIATHTFTTTFEHTSNTSTLPNGVYKNYYQMYIPKNSSVKSMVLDNEVLTPDKYELRQENNFLIPTIYVEIQPDTKRTLTLTYDTPLQMDYIQKEKTIIQTYNVTLQKQIGLDTTLYNLTITFPKSSSVIDQNFNARIQNQKIKKDILLSTDVDLSLTYSTERQ